METYKNKKKEEPIVATIQVGQPSRPLNYPYHICGHKLTNYARFGEMQTMFKDKRGSTI
jgi:hypothetical protein